MPRPGAHPTVLAFVSALPAAPASLIERGAAAMTAADSRWARCDIKATSLLANVLLRWQAADAETSEAILLRDGWLTEGSTSSVHVVRSGRLLTPPQTHAILPGTTRGVLFDLAAREGIASERRPVSEAELRGAEEVIIASAGGGIRAVTVLDGAAIGGGSPGPLFRRLYAGFLATKAEFSTELPA